MADAKPTVHQSIASFLEKKMEAGDDMHPWYYFEPWDVKKRGAGVLAQAEKDGINLYDEELVDHCGRDPHPFQTGYLLSKARLRTLLAGSRVGKTITTLVELGIMVSGEKPISMRYDRGVRTPVKRLVTPDNIIRFGRFDVDTGAFIDHDTKQLKPNRSMNWDCGNIHGVGVYPDEKICPAGDVCWIGTTHQALLEFWWPHFTEKADSMFPAEFIDRRSGNDGYMKSEWSVMCVRGTRITIISYESGFRKYEATEVHSAVFDEESPDQACVTSAVNHCKYFSMAMTPYLGVTYTKKMIFNPKKNPHENQVFHATAYDSPYLTPETIAHRRSLMPAHEIGARIWGLHTEMRNKPYFDSVKINVWLRGMKPDYKLIKYLPGEEFEGMRASENQLVPGLMDIDILDRQVQAENRQDVWRVYEDWNEDTAYYLMADSAEGSDIPDESADILAAMVMRPPKDEETFPQIVASLRSTLMTHVFARVCLYAARYWNNALMCAEGPTRGSFNALFFAETKDYPFWFLQTSIRDSTRKARSVKGFDTNAATRGAIFDGIREVLDEWSELEVPEIRDEPLLRELANCIVVIKNGKKRPDHDSRSSLDTSICYGQGLYVWKNYANQIKCRPSPKRRKVGFLERQLKKMIDSGKAPVYLGEGVQKLR